MISLLQYILESVLSNELSKEFKIEEITTNVAYKILKETNGFKKLGMGNENEKEIVYWDVSQHYKMIYKDKCIGVFALYDFNNIGDTIEKYDNNKYMSGLLRIIVQMFRLPISRKENINTTNEFLKRSIYVTYLLMLSDNQKELDISPIATIKVFFNKLKEICNKQHKDIICANGKDDRITKLYCKCGGFKLLKEIYDNDDMQFYKKHFEGLDTLNSSVFYKI